MPIFEVVAAALSVVAGAIAALSVVAGAIAALGILLVVGIRQ